MSDQGILLLLQFSSLDRDFLNCSWRVQRLFVLCYYCKRERERERERESERVNDSLNKKN
jgi:hypothetical protein